MGRNRNGLVQGDPAVAQRFERQIKGHHLGQAGGMTRLVGVHLLQHVAGGGIDDDGTVTSRSDLCLRRNYESGCDKDSCGQQPYGQADATARQRDNCLREWHAKLAIYVPF